MQVSRAYVQAFVGQLAAIDANIRRYLKQEVTKRDLERRIASGEADAYEEASEIMQTAISGGTTLAGSLATRYYDGIRGAAKPKTKYQAQTVPVFDAGSVIGAAFAVAAEYARGGSEKPLDELFADTATRYTHYAADETVRQNTKRDPAKPKYAILPGVDACEFCRMRAALGEEYANKSSVESHNNCTCAAVPVFGNSKIQGYDPKADENAYKAARDAYRNGEYSEALAKKIEAAKERHNAAYKRNEVARPWRETNAILMVWREMDKGEA